MVQRERQGRQGLGARTLGVRACVSRCWYDTSARRRRGYPRGVRLSRSSAATTRSRTQSYLSRRCLEFVRESRSGTVSNVLCASNDQAPPALSPHNHARQCNEPCTHAKRMIEGSRSKSLSLSLYNQAYTTNHTSARLHHLSYPPSERRRRRVARERRKKRRSHPHTQRKRASLLGPTLSSGQGIPGPRHALIFVPRLDFCRFSLRRPSLLGWNSALLRAPRNVSNR